MFARVGSVPGMNLAKTARNAAVADVALAFARDRIAAQLPGVQPRKRRTGRKALVIGGVAAAAAAAVLLKRDKVAALLPGRRDEPATPAESYTPPPVSNYDVAGPVANTATSVPVPPAYETPTIDEAEEEAAAAAEAANIGGQVSDYAGPAARPPPKPRRRWPRPAKARPRARSRPRTSCAMPPRATRTTACRPRRPRSTRRSTTRRIRSPASRSSPLSRPTTPSRAPGPAAPPNRRKGELGSRTTPAPTRAVCDAIGAGDDARTPKLTRALPASATIGASSR